MAVKGSVVFSLLRRSKYVIHAQAVPSSRFLSLGSLKFRDVVRPGRQALRVARKYMETNKGPYCLLVPMQNFSPFKLDKGPNIFPISREGAVQVIVDSLKDPDLVVSTTGMLSRELFEYRAAKGQGHEKDFLTVGSMGHTSAIALGIAQFRPNRQVFCLDGDGAVLMPDMGALATIGQSETPNFKHIVVNNGSHASVGGEPTCGLSEKFDFLGIAKACGYKAAMRAEQPEDITEAVKLMRSLKGPVLLEIKVNEDRRKDLGKPTKTLVQNKIDFMDFL